MDVSKAAAVLGRLGGLTKTPAKSHASRMNGKKGGRPKKSAQVKTPSQV